MFNSFLFIFVYESGAYNDPDFVQLGLVQESQFSTPGFSVYSFLLNWLLNEPDFLWSLYAGM